MTSIERYQAMRDYGVDLGQGINPDEPLVPQSDWTRDFENVKNDDVIYIKKKVEEIFEKDPDLLDMLGIPEKKIKHKGMTEEEKLDIEDYNTRITDPAIIPWLKLNDIIMKVQNVVMFDVSTERMNYDNPAFSRQHLNVMIMIHESSMDTEFNIPRADLVAYIIKDLINRTDVLGMNVVLSYDQPRIVDNAFYCREMRFTSNQVNRTPGHPGLGNKYDKLY